MENEIVNGKLKVWKMREHDRTMKVIFTSLFAALALSLYFYGLINLAGVCLILGGALWNYFIDINSAAAFLLSVVVGVLYAMFAISEGFYVNALLYTIFYIPLQFFVWIRFSSEGDFEVKYTRKLSDREAYRALIMFFMALSLCFVVTFVVSGEQQPFLDSMSACMLALSAVLQSLRFREYYVIRPLAILSAFALWIYNSAIIGFDPATIAMVLLYSMYLLSATSTLNTWIDLTYPWQLPHKEKQQKNALILDEDERLKLNTRLEEYNELMRSMQEAKSGDNDNIRA